MDDQQARTLLLTVKGTHYEALFWVAMPTGMRQGELLGLQWSMSSGKCSQPKCEAGRRSTILGKSTLKVLRAHIAYSSG